MRGAIRNYGTSTRPFDGSKPDFGLKFFSESRAFSSQSPAGRATYHPAAAASCLYAPKISFNRPVAENTDAIARQWRGPLSSTVMTKSGDIFGGSCRSLDDVSKVLRVDGNAKAKQVVAMRIIELAR